MGFQRDYGVLNGLEMEEKILMKVFKREMMDFQGKIVVFFIEVKILENRRIFVELKTFKIMREF